ncbi:hypothetical protein [Streptomyces sp. NPDC048669]|uniref:hypothetical protein n=1 Tax=Streptomyces sp. NPDC048669 TaxID=3155267 RepID=UPI003442FDD2
MSQDTAPARRVIGVEEHARTPEPRRALLRWGGDAVRRHPDRFAAFATLPVNP